MAALALASCGWALACAAAMLMLTAIPVLALIAGVAGSAIPFAMRARRRRTWVQDMRSGLPVLLDRLAVGMRAGQSLPAAFVDAAVAADGVLAPVLTLAASDMRVTADTHAALRACAATLDDAMADRTFLAVCAVADIGGASAPAVLQAAAAQIRAELIAQAEAEARRAWVTTSAAIAVCAPWVTVVALALRSGSLNAYRSPAGGLVLLMAAGLCALGYACMRLIGRARPVPRVVDL